MEMIIFEMVAYYAPQLMQAALYLVACILGMTAGKYLKPLLQNKVVEIFARNAVLFVEQTCKDLHGDDKLNKALEKLSAKLAVWKINITADEMKFMLEAAVAKFNEAFKKPVTAGTSPDDPIATIEQ